MGVSALDFKKRSQEWSILDVWFILIVSLSSTQSIQWYIRFEWCINDPSWQLIKASKIDEKKTNFFSQKEWRKIYVSSMVDGTIFQRELVDDHSKGFRCYNFEKRVVGTWKSSMWNRYLFVSLLSIRYPLFTVILLYSWRKQVFSTDLQPIKQTYVSSILIPYHVCIHIHLFSNIFFVCFFICFVHHCSSYLWLDTATFVLFIVLYVYII